MINQNKSSRREFLFSAAAVLLIAHVPIAVGVLKNPYKTVDWGVVLNRVIGDRNALNAGFNADMKSYKFGSPEWCMEEVLAGHGLLAEGAPIHV